MARIIRLTESDLARIVRRVINENEQTKYQQLYNAVAGPGTNEEAFLKVLETIRDKAEYDKINAIGEAKGEDIISLYKGDFGVGTTIYQVRRFCTKLSQLRVSLPKTCTYTDIFGGTNSNVVTPQQHGVSR
jgi:phosphopantetheinyl transferase (holo-ACP synthase)